MYFVDREKIEKSLTYIEQMNNVLNQQQSWETTVEKLAVERIIHMTIEAIIDVGNAMIDGFIMRDPGSYEDIIDILQDEKVIQKADADQLKELFSLRKQLIYGYHGIDHATLLNTLENVKGAIHQFPSEVRRYLTEELGPVSAFIPNNKGNDLK